MFAKEMTLKKETAEEKEMNMGWKQVADRPSIPSNNFGLGGDDPQDLMQLNVQVKIEKITLRSVLRTLFGG